MSEQASLFSLSYRVAIAIIHGKRAGDRDCNYFLASPTGRLVHESREMRGTNADCVLVVACEENTLSLGAQKRPQYKLFGILWFRNSFVRAHEQDWVFEVCDPANTKKASELVAYLAHNAKHGGRVRVRVYKYRHSETVLFLRNFQPF